ncbi:ribonuclease T2-like [Linnemannia elongata]|nr:ribonuclease T2-like [Linnemannia elongata]
MKLLSSITLAIGLFTLLKTSAAADPVLNTTAIQPFDANSCPLNVLSCSPDSRNINACCLPSMGLIVLVQQWFDGVGPSNAFTLHGLWPDTCAGGHGPPNGCDSRRVYNNVAARLQSYKGIQTGFMDDMATYWGSFKGDNNAFWSHEWSKHGTCISNLSPSCTNPSTFTPNQDVYEYFRQGLELRAQYDLYTALAKAGILPGSNPDVVEMHEAIGSAFGVDAQINCEGGVLNEVWMYFNVKNGNQYVPTGPKYPGSCRGYISYPIKKRALPARPPSPPPGQSPPQVPPPSVITTNPTGAWPTRPTTNPITTTTARRTTTQPAGPVRTGVQTGTCSTEGATVCVNPGVSKQFSKCDRGRWIVNECRVGKVCFSDTGVSTHCE